MTILSLQFNAKSCFVCSLSTGLSLQVDEPYLILASFLI